VLWSTIFITTIIFTSFSDFTKDLLLIAFVGGIFFLIKFFHQKNFNSKKHIESAGTFVLSITAGIGILITVIITASILFEAIRFFQIINPLEFLFGTTWNPQMAITSEQEVGSSSFGMIPVFPWVFLLS
jgi:phosphate transport system permease protein